MSNDNNETDKIVDFAERLRYVLELKINKLRIKMHESTSRADTDRFTIKIQALEWVQGRIQDLVINNTTKEKFAIK
jgi:hypothetical protein